MLESWPIARRVAAGFAVVTAVVVSLALFSYFSVNRLGGGYSEYRQTARQNIAISAYVEDLFEARVAALKFRTQPTSTNSAEVVSNLDEILDDTVFRPAFQVDAARMREIDDIFALAEEYKLAFAQTVQQTEALLAAKAALTAEGETLERLVTEIFGAIAQTGDQTAILRAGATLGALANSRVTLKQYFVSREVNDFALAKQQFAEFQTELQSLVSIGFSGPATNMIDELQQEVAGHDELMQEFSRINQAIKTTNRDVLDRIGPEMQDRLDLLASQIVDRQNELGPEGSRIVDTLGVIIPAAGILATLLAIASAFVIGRWIAGSVWRLANATSRLADGDTSIKIEGAEHNHELGRVAKALAVFKEAHLERERNAAEREAMQKSQQLVVSAMQSELKQLAHGDLTAQIRQSFDPEYEDLRINFNDAVIALQKAIAKVSDTSAIIRSTTAEANTATTELSQRTENQAATLEETAAALDQLTASVKSAAEHAKSVDSSVNKARSEAERNGDIVQQAVQAMQEIDESSKQITQVISVIDDIAFQTNLLALNAGVEAARAGESGRGFAVVASEVRALAQRSAEAAKEISSLITNSSTHVTQGTKLVGSAGDALFEIITQVNEIASMTSQIATSSEEQALGLSEINIGVNQLDQVTQQNAAMVQESISRGDALAQETRRLNELIASFRVGDEPATPISDITPRDALSEAIDQTNAPAPTFTHRAPPRQVAAGGNTAEAMWEDF